MTFIEEYHVNDKNVRLYSKGESIEVDSIVPFACLIMGQAKWMKKWQFHSFIQRYSFLGPNRVQTFKVGPTAAARHDG